MKDLHGSANTTVAASLDRCRALLEEVDRYPQWYPAAVREVEVLERTPSGRPATVRAKLHLSRGPLVKDFDLVLGVVSESEPKNTVRLTRIADPGSSRFAVTWRLSGAGSTRIVLDLDASMPVPRFMPLGDVGDAIAEGFIAAARDALARPDGDERS